MAAVSSEQKGYAVGELTSASAVGRCGDHVLSLTPTPSCCPHSDAASSGLCYDQAAVYRATPNFHLHPQPTVGHSGDDPTPTPLSSLLHSTAGPLSTLASPSQPMSKLQETYRLRAPRYADLTFDEFLAQDHKFPLPDHNRCRCERRLAFSCLVVFTVLAYNVAWGMLHLFGGDVLLVYAAIPYTPTIQPRDGRVFNFTRGEGGFGFNGYQERVWIVNTSTSATDDVLYTHYGYTTGLSSSCQYAVFNNVTALGQTTRLDKDYLPYGHQDLILTAPNCGAFETARVTFIFFWVLQVFIYATHAMALTYLASLWSAARDFERDIDSDGLEPGPPNGLVGSLFMRRIFLAGDVEGVVRAPMPSRQRMTEFFLARQIKTFQTTGKFYQVLLAVLPWPCLFLVICFVCVLVFVSSADFHDSRLGSVLYVHVAGTIAYLVLVPFSIFLYGSVRNEAKGQIRDLGGDIHARPARDALLAEAGGDSGLGEALSPEDPQPRPPSALSAGPLAAAPVQYAQLPWLVRKVMPEADYERALEERRRRAAPV